MEKIEVCLLIYKPKSEYLITQLESLLQQNYRNFHLKLIIDSKDNIDYSFLEILQGKINYEVVINPIRNGVDRNIFYILKKSINDIIFFCDQDDYWEKNKILYYISEFNSDPGLALIAANTTLWDKVFEKDTTLNEGYKPYTIYGHTIAIRKKYFNIDRFWFTTVYPVYDTFLIRYAVLSKLRIKFLKKSFTKYRIHESQLTYNKKINFIKRYKLKFNYLINTLYILCIIKR